LILISVGEVVISSRFTYRGLGPSACLNSGSAFHRPARNEKSSGGQREATLGQVGAPCGGTGMARPDANVGKNVTAAATRRTTDRMLKRYFRWLS